MPLFDGYIAVDWSARVEPVQGPNSVWIAAVIQEEQVLIENPATRQEAMNRIGTLLDEANDRGHRLLCGFDFAFGYPVGTARMMIEHFNPQVNGNWKTTWALIAAFIEDDVNDQPNMNNRFDAAAVLNGLF